METSKEPRPLADLAKEALDVQDACNLSGVVHAWSRAISDLWKQPGASTSFVNEHPINVLWADKCAHLTKTQPERYDSERSDRIAAAWSTAAKMAGR